MLSLKPILIGSVKIYTSYFAQLKKVKNPISIARFNPSWYEGPLFLDLAPSSTLLHSFKEGWVSQDYFIKCYNQTLSTLDPGKTVAQLLHFYPEETEVTLLCYEKLPDFCHRHLVSTWLNNNHIPSQEAEFKVNH